MFDFSIDSDNDTQYIIEVPDLQKRAHFAQSCFRKQYDHDDKFVIIDVDCYT